MSHGQFLLKLFNLLVQFFIGSLPLTWRSWGVLIFMSGISLAVRTWSCWGGSARGGSWSRSSICFLVWLRWLLLKIRIVLLNKILVLSILGVIILFSSLLLLLFLFSFFSRFLLHRTSLRWLLLRWGLHFWSRLGLRLIRILNIIDKSINIHLLHQLLLLRQLLHLGLLSYLSPSSDCPSHSTLLFLFPLLLFVFPLFAFLTGFTSEHSATSDSFGSKHLFSFLQFSLLPQLI